MACVRVKRRLSDGVTPSPAIVVKRLKLSTDDQSSQSDRKSDEDFKAVFKFVGTVQSKDEIVDSHISKAVVSECKALSSSGGGDRDWRQIGAKSDRTHKKISAKDKKNGKNYRRRQATKEQKKAGSTEARYRLVSTLRGVVDANDDPSNIAADGRGDRAKGSAFDEAVKGLYTLYDMEELPANDIHLPNTNIAEQITCNGVTMICEREPIAKYVYDLYFLHDCNVEELESTQELVSIEPCFDSEARDLRSADCDDSDVEAAEDDDDSNDESNWRNDYPEEDDDFEKDYDYYRDYGDGDGELDEELMEGFQAYTIGSPSAAQLECGEEDESRRCFEEDLRLHGRTYAEFKARLRSYVEGDISGDILKDAKPSNTLKDC